MRRARERASEERRKKDIIMALKRKHKLLLRNLSDNVSTGVDGTGIMDVGRSSKSSQRTNKIAAGVQ